jgi:streptogramin lyase
VATRWRYRAAALAVFAALVSAAAALAGFDVTRWGSSGVSDGQFTNVVDVAVGPTGTVYALDTTPGRIQRFTAAGKFIGSSEASTGQFIAVDATGIYVAKSGGGGIVAHLTPTGGLVKQWEVPNPHGIAVTDGFVYVVASGSEIRKYTTGGTLVKTWPISTTEIFPGGLDLSIDPAGNVYVVQNWGAIRKYSPGGELLTTGYTALPGEIYGAGVNPSTGDVWVSAEDGNAMVKLSSSLDKVLATVKTAGLSSPRGVGVGCTDAYVANTGTNEIVRIHPTGALPLCGATKLPRVWFPPVEVDPSTKTARVSGTCLGPGRCRGLLGIETLARKCTTGGRATRCVLARVAFNFGKGQTIRLSVKLKSRPRVLDSGTAITLIKLKGNDRLLPLDRVALVRASSSLTLGCRKAGLTGESFPYSGILTPALGDAHVRVAIASPDGSVEVREATTGSAGDFTGSFTPRTPGSYSVLAFWRGNTKLDGAQSPACRFTVSPAQTTSTTTAATTTGTTTTTASGPPDLVISDLAKDSATVKNIGNGAAGTFMLTVNTTEGPSQFVIEDLPAGSSATVSFSCQAGPVTAVADSANQVTESNETNNTKTIAVVSC